MEDFFKMDVFFVVATTVTALIGVLIMIALVYAIRFLRTVNRISENVEEEAVALREDIANARKSVQGFNPMKIFSLFASTGARVRRRKTKAEQQD